MCVLAGATKSKSLEGGNVAHYGACLSSHPVFEGNVTPSTGNSKTPAQGGPLVRTNSMINDSKKVTLPNKLYIVAFSRF